LLLYSLIQDVDQFLDVSGSLLVIRFSVRDVSQIRQQISFSSRLKLTHGPVDPLINKRVLIVTATVDISTLGKSGDISKDSMRFEDVSFGCFQDWESAIRVDLLQEFLSLGVGSSYTRNQECVLVVKSNRWERNWGEGKFFCDLLAIAKLFNSTLTLAREAATWIPLTRLLDSEPQTF